MPLALLALALATFGAGTAEFVMMGLLPQTAAEMEVPLSDAGGYISCYALGVVIGAPVLTVAGLRARRKTVLLAVTGLFIVGNVATALAPNHALLLAARFTAGLPHGVFFGTGAVVAAGLVRPERRGRALSLVLVGIPAANIVGSPLGTLLGQSAGWRWTFAAVTGVGALALGALALFLPAQQQVDAARGSMRGELGVFKRPQVWLAYAVVVCGFGGTSSFYTYILPMVTEVSGYTPAAATALLSLSGAGMTVGTLLGGRFAHMPQRTTCWTLAALTMSLALFALTARHTVLVAVNVFLTGVAGMAAIPSIQARILDQNAEAPELGSATIQSAFNIANSLGASLGGLVIAAGYGLTSPSMLGALLALTGTALTLLSRRLDHRTPVWRPARARQRAKSTTLGRRRPYVPGARPGDGTSPRPDPPASPGPAPSYGPKRPGLSPGPVRLTVHGESTRCRAAVART